MKNLLMLILSIVTAALLGGTLYVFFNRLRSIEDAFWGRERDTVKRERKRRTPLAEDETDGVEPT